MAWSPNGSWLATRCDAHPCAVFVWDVARLQLAALLLQAAPVRDLAWDTSRDVPPRLVLVTGGPRLYVWTRAGASVVTVPSPAFRAAALAFNASGSVCTLTTATDGGAPATFCCAYASKAA